MRIFFKEYFPYENNLMNYDRENHIENTNRIKDRTEIMYMSENSNNLHKNELIIIIIVRAVQYGHF